MKIVILAEGEKADTVVLRKEGLLQNIKQVP
jgi:hypothetical protein